MSKKHHILLSIINWNNNRATAECLKSIAQTPKPNQPDILLIDNHSERELFSLPNSVLSELRFVKIVKNNQNLGFAGGHNFSLKYAQAHKYEFVFLLNNDTELLDADTFQDLANTLEKNPSAAAVAPTILSDRQGTIWYAGGKINYLTSSTKHYGFGEKNLRSKNKPKPVSFLSGCCLGLRVSHLNKIGLLDDRYFMYWEDADWSARASKAGFTLLHSPRISILHNVSSSLGIASPSYIYYIVRNNILFIKRNIRFLARPISYLRVGAVTCRFLLKTKFRLNAIKSLWYGWRDGLMGKTGKFGREL